MSEKITTKRFVSNVISSIIAQTISLLLSFVLTLIVPKFIDEYQYAYWQTYVLYVGYVGVLHFGLLDGLVLRYSKYDYEELDKERLRSQFIILLVINSILSFMSILISSFVFSGVNQYIIILVAVGIITKNVVTYSSYLFQITNRISKYVILIISQRLSYGIFVCLLLISKVQDFYWYCIADLCGDLVGIFIGIIFNKGLYLGKSLKLKDSFDELKLNISSGLLLMLANWSSMLIVGGAKMIIQWHWDELVFGKVSFAFSVSNLFLTFVTAVSVVLFPSLQRVDEEKLPSIYKNTRGILSQVLFLIMIFYFPGCWLLNLWLPKYSNSLIYLGILLPMIVYTSKVSLLTNNYLKLYRKEKILLLINAISILIGIISFVICAYVFNSIKAVLLSVVIVSMIKSIMSEVCVFKLIHIKIIKDFVIEGIMTIGFILCTSLLNWWLGCLIYLGLYIIYAIMNYKSIVAIFNKLFKRKRLQE